MPYAKKNLPLIIIDFEGVIGSFYRDTSSMLLNNKCLYVRSET